MARFEIKYNLDLLTKICTDRGYEFLSISKKGHERHVDFICKNGHKGSQRVSRFVSGMQCVKCWLNEVKINLPEIKKRCKEMGFTLLSKRCNGRKTKLILKCKHGHISRAGIAKLYYGRQCSVCADIQFSINQTTSISDIENLFKSYGYRLITKIYKPRKNLKFVCNNGHVGTILLGDFKNGHRCRTCYLEKSRPRGKLHYNYNPEISDEDREKHRHFPEYIDWAKKVKEINNYTCLACKKRGGKLRSHHIEGWKINKELRFDVKNGACLCDKCHNEYHAIRGPRASSNARDFYTWLDTKVGS